MKDLRDLTDLTMHDVSATNKLQYGETHFATRLTITSEQRSMEKQISGHGRSVEPEESMVELSVGKWGCSEKAERGKVE